MMQAVRLTPNEIDKVTRFMREASGNDLSDKTALVGAKMGALCTACGYRHFWEFWDDVQQNGIAAGRLRQQVIDELTTNYSYFYRENAHYALLGKLLASGSVPAGSGGLTIWSAGCATGEEAYNLAMTVEDARRSGTWREGYQVVGSDISTRAVESATTGRYDVANVARMPPHWRNLYCVRDGQGYHVRSALRRHVEFRLENVLTPRPHPPFDVVVCRNMLIYFDRASVERFCSVLRARVRPGGYLFLGHTEILGQIGGFAYLEPSVWQRDA